MFLRALSLTCLMAASMFAAGPIAPLTADVNLDGNPDIALANQGGSTVTIHFGSANPLGLARYAQIEGRPEVVLLPAFVAEAWEQMMSAR